MSKGKHKSYCNYPNDLCDCGVCPEYLPGSGFSRNSKLYTKEKPKPTMTNPRLAGLTAEEREFYNIVCLLVEDHGNVAMKKQDYKKVKDVLESLSLARASEDRKRKLLKEIEWNSFDEKGYPMCPKCQRLPSTHAPDCAIAAELGGGGRVI